MPQKPDNYGNWWRTHDHGAPWYAQIYVERLVIHESFIEWYRQQDAVEPIDSVLEVGCGCAVVYPNVFIGKQYTGYDFSAKEIAWCKANRAREGRSFHCGDFIVPAERPAEKYDLVFSHAVIDHVYDCAAFLAACVERSNRWVYLTSYRGWFPAIADHVYAWDEWTTAFYNSISPGKVLTQLQALGCTDIRVEPMETGKTAIPQETIIIARVPG